MDEKTFIRQYAAEIALALREQEESPHFNQSSSVEDSVQKLYRELCFDEPLLDDRIPNLTTAASALSRQLISASSSYALSNRLVNGIVYLCRQRSSSSNSSSSSSSNQTAPKPATTTSSDALSPGGNSKSSGIHVVPDNPTLTLALAKLVFCVLVQVPLECCELIQTKNLAAVQNYLGSYKGTISVEISGDPNTELILNSSDDHQTTTDQRVNQLAESLAAVGSESVAPSENKFHAKENGILQEVWADDSDPSDYDYGESDANVRFSQFPQSATDLVELLDPMILSKPDRDGTLDQARAAIVSLLQQANYSILSPLFQLLSKKQVEPYISQLTQLLLLLLQPPQSLLVPDDDRNREESFSTSQPLQDAILTPLWILRDAALFQPSQEQSFYTSSYLEVLQTLLAVDQAYQSDTNQKQNPLCTASIVGLSAFSSWCCSAHISSSATTTTTTAILDSMNDLAHVMVRASESGYGENLKHSMTPILEILSGITYQDANKVQLGSTTAGMMIPQTMLNSGLLRQLLILSLENYTVKSCGVSSARSPPYYLDHALWGLCVVYPTVIGKYVARYPEFPTIVRRYHQIPPDTMTSRDCVHSILWYCFAFSHCSDGSQAQAPRVVWRTKAPSSSSTNGGPAPLPPPPPQATPLTKDECQEVCQKSWVRLCRMVQSSLEIEPPSPKKALEVVHDWERLLNLVRVPSVGVTFQSLIPDHDTQLEAISQSLSQTATTETTNDSAVANGRSKKEKLDEEDDEKKKSSMSTQQIVAATTRKMLKQYTLFFQGNVRGSSKTD